MPDERAETDETQGQATSNIAWFLTGAFIGAAAAVLYAPQSGKDTRKLISDKTQQGREAVESAGTGYRRGEQGHVRTRAQTGG